MTPPRRHRPQQPLKWSLPIFVLLVALSCPAGAQVYVANSSSGTVSVINTPDNTPGPAIPVGSLPTAVAITPDGKFVYVINHNSGTLSKIDTAGNTVVATIHVGSLPNGVAVSPDGASVFVVVGTSLVRLSVATNAVMENFTLPVGIPVDVAITPNNLLAYVVDQSQNGCSLYPLVLATRIILNNSEQCPGGTGAVGGSFPEGVAVRPDGQFVYVTAFKDGALQVVRVSDNLRMGGGLVSASGPFFGGPVGVAVSSDSKFAFTANSNESKVAIFALDATTGLPGPPIRVSLASNPKYLDVTPDGRFLYVTHGSNSVSVIDLKASPPSVVKTITVGSDPWGIAVSPLASSGTPPPAPPVLSATLAASPGTITVGESIAVTMTVTNTGGSAATAVSAQSSLSVSGGGGVTQTSGPSPGPTTIGAGGSQAFTYTYSASSAGSVSFNGSASGGGVSSIIATSNTVTIQSPVSPPTLSVAPGSLSFTGELGFADPVPQSLQIANSGGGTLAWSVTPSIIGDGNWLSASPATGSAPPAASVSVTSSTCGLPAAAYNGSLSVSANGASGSPQSIPVTLIVTQAAITPPSPRVRVCVDRPTYRTGETLRLSVSLRQGSSSNVGDAYLFAPVPGVGGTTFVSLMLSAGQIVPQIGPALVPLGRNFQVPDFAGKIFERPFDGSEPPGVYVINAILALSDTDPTVAANQIAVAVGSLTFVP